MTVLISFVVCTYNPELNRLSRVLECIDAQVEIDTSLVEILLVDNRSDLPVRDTLHGAFNCEFRVIRENTPGLTSARLRGSAEARGELIVFVDDDNLLATDYAATIVFLARTHPRIGVLSAGQILPEYEAEPPKDIRRYWPFMALIDSNKDTWSNIPGSGVLPMGAGMVVRRLVMDEYALQLKNDSFRSKTDRVGSSLAAGGDTDIGLVSCEIGLGCGIFPDLKLVHVMPKERLDLAYLQRLVRDVSYSTTRVMCRGNVWRVKGRTVLKRLLIAISATFAVHRPGASVQRIVEWSRFRAYKDSYLRDRK